MAKPKILQDIDNHTSQLVDMPKLGYVNTTLNNWKDRFENFYVNIKDFGAIGNGVVDDTAAIQNAINYSCSNGYPMIKIPHGVYNITATLTTPQAFNQPIIVGDNSQTTIFNYPTIASGQACIKFKGGSGQLTGSYISNITFNGNANSIGIIFADVCGIKAIHCKFGLNKIGVRLLNESISAFTEYAIVDSCDFASNCSTVLEYKRISGDNSFHGSGLIGCTMNQDVTETSPKIVINGGCLPYNSPMSFQCWSRNSNTALILNSGDTRSNFHGNITIEPFNVTPINLVDPSGSNIYFVGGVLSNSENLILGKMVVCERVQMNTDATLNTRRKPSSTIVQLNNGSTNLAYVDDCETKLLDIRITATNYEYNYTLIAFKNYGDNNGKVTILATNRQFNGAGYSDPTFTFSNGYVVITNANYPSNTVKVYMTTTVIGSRAIKFMS